MPTHAERRVVPFSPEQMYALVADVERYPEFLPWCVFLKITHQHDNIIESDMAVGFKALREKFTTRVTLTPPERIEVEYLNGPFRYLNNHWVFHKHAKGCEIEFYIDFEFRSKMLQLIIGTLFGEAVRVMVRAFEMRARALYAK